MSSLQSMISADVVAAIWLAAMLAVWFFLYAASKASGGPGSGSRY